MTLAPHSKSGFEKLRLPDFLGIGALKAATTYLDALLRAHPQLCLPPGLKEVQFFNRYYDRGVEWYAGLFSSCDGRRRGEISPQYLFDESCPARIASVLPDVRLLVSIRDPVQRAYSQYKHWVEERGYREPFETFLADHPGAIARGEYFRSVCRYLDYFPFEHIHVLLAEELVSRPAPVLAEIFQFLDVDPALAPAPAERAQNVSTVPRFHRLYVVTKRVTRWLYGRGGAQVVHTAKRLGLPRFHRLYVVTKRVTRWLYGRGGAQVVYTAKRLGLPRLFHDGSVRGTFPPLAPDTAERLRAHYSADVAGLSQLLGRDLSTYWWRLDNPAYQE